MAAQGSGGCCVTNTTSALLAQGTVSGLLLAALVWAGVGLLGLFLLWLFLMILLGILCATLDCVCQCTGVSGGGEPCCGPCDPCGGCCDDCGGCGSGDGGGGTGGGGGGGATDEIPAGGLLLPGSALAAALLARGRGIDLAHHPDHADYRMDVYRVGPHRLCVGCFTTYPLFLLAASMLFLLHPAVPWLTGLAVGLGLASLQAVSALGWTRTRLQKIVVKSALGLGLALYTYSALTAPVAFWVSYLLLGGALALAFASTIPRRVRMRRKEAVRGVRCDCARTR